MIPRSPEAWTEASGRARLHIVSGKGGTGKTTVAAGLALAFARGGSRVLLLEVEERQGIAQAFGIPPLPDTEHRLADFGHGHVDGLAVLVDTSMLEYLEMHVGLGLAGRAMRRVGAIEFATTIAPGLKDVILTGKVKECVERRGPDGRPAYDAIVLDAPPTGRIGRFLDVTTAMADLAKGGPIRAQAETVIRLFHSEQTVVHLVALPEAMPWQETLDAIGELRDLEIPVGSVLVNRAPPRLLPDEVMAELVEGRADAAALARGMAAAGIDDVDAAIPGLLTQSIQFARTVAAKRAVAETITASGIPTLVLPEMIGGVDASRLEHISDELLEQGVRHG